MDGKQEQGEKAWSSGNVILEKNDEDTMVEIMATEEGLDEVGMKRQLFEYQQEKVMGFY